MIRPYRDTDLNELLDAWYSASLLGHPFLDDTFFQQERINIRDVHLPKAETWVFEEDGVVVGFIALIENEVGGIFVDLSLLAESRHLSTSGVHVDVPAR